MTLIRHGVIVISVLTLVGIAHTHAFAQETNVKDMVSGSGICRMELVKGAGYGQCKPGFIYMLFKNGRDAIMFSLKDETVITLAGSGDRQPRLEDYYMSIDRFRMKRPSQQEAVDPNMEGECHIRVTREAGDFREIDCDVYDRADDLSVSVKMDSILNSEHRHFN